MKLAGIEMTWEMRKAISVLDHVSHILASGEIYSGNTEYMKTVMDGLNCMKIEGDEEVKKLIDAIIEYHNYWLKD